MDQIHSYLPMKRRDQRVVKPFSGIFILLNKHTQKGGLSDYSLSFSVFLNFLKMKRNEQEDCIQPSPHPLAGTLLFLLLYEYGDQGRGEGLPKALQRPGHGFRITAD